jgi:hypothetical protein
MILELRCHSNPNAEDDSRARWEKEGRFGTLDAPFEFFYIFNDCVYKTWFR